MSNTYRILIKTHHYMNDSLDVVYMARVFIEAGSPREFSVEWEATKEGTDVPTFSKVYAENWGDLLSILTNSRIPWPSPLYRAMDREFIMLKTSQEPEDNRDGVLPVQELYIPSGPDHDGLVISTTIGQQGGMMTRVYRCTRGWWRSEQPTRWNSQAEYLKALPSLIPTPFPRSQ